VSYQLNIGSCASRSRLEPEQSNVSKSPLSPEKASQTPLDDSEEKLSAEESKGKNKTQLYFTFCGKACLVNSASFTLQGPIPASCSFSILIFLS